MLSNTDVVGVFIATLICLLLFFQPVGFTIVIGTSMEPAIGDGDITVHSQYVEAEEGDVVRTYSPNDNYPYPIIHRVVKTNAETVQTKGDNNSLTDPEIKKEYVTSTVFFVVDVPSWAQVYRGLFPQGYDELEQSYS